MAKHYVRLNGKGEITKGFSDELEVPETEDVLINEDSGRQFELAGQVNPALMDKDIYLYVYKNGEVKRKTDKSIQKEQEAIDSARVVEPTEVAKLNAALLEMGEMVATLAEQVEQIGG